MGKKKVLHKQGGSVLLVHEVECFGQNSIELRHILRSLFPAVLEYVVSQIQQGQLSV